MEQIVDLFIQRADIGVLYSLAATNQDLRTYINQPEKLQIISAALSFGPKNSLTELVIAYQNAIIETKTCKEGIDSVPEICFFTTFMQLAKKVAFVWENELKRYERGNRTEHTQYLCRKLIVSALTENYIHLEMFARLYIHVFYILYPHQANQSLQDNYFAILNTARDPTKARQVLLSVIPLQIHSVENKSRFAELVERYQALPKQNYQTLFDFVVDSYNNLHPVTPPSFATNKQIPYKTDEVRQELEIIIDMASQTKSISPLNFYAPEVFFNLDEATHERVKHVNEQWKLEAFREYFYNTTGPSLLLQPSQSIR